MKLKKWLAPVLSLSLLVPAFSVASVAGAAEPNTPTTDTPAVELRAGLDYLLSEHFTLAVISMTKSYDGASDAAAAQAALEKNAADMVPAISGIYGEAGGKEFDRIFSAHNKYTDDYAKAVKMNDSAGKAAALQKDEAFAQEFGSFLGTATAGNLPTADAQAAVRTHEAQVVAVLDAYAAGNYSAAYSKFREGLNYMFGISDKLSSAIVTQMPDKFGGTRPDTAAGNLRSALNHLAAEHYALATISMQKGIDKSPAYASILTAEAGNTADFRAAIASIYGSDAGAAFEKVWTGNHINAQDMVVKAVNAGDSAAEAAARAKIMQFAQEFGNFLGTATGGKLPADAAVSAVSEHERLVLEAFDIYKTSGKANLYTSFDSGYKFMFGVGKALGGAIVAQHPEMFKPANPTPTPTPTPTPAPSNDVMTIWLKVGSKLVKVDGKDWMADVAPSVTKGTTYVSLRTLTTALGADVTYMASDKSVHVQVGDDTVVFWLGKDMAKVNGKTVKTGAVVYETQGRTQVPLRYIAQLLGWNLNWNKSDWSVTLTKSM